MIVFIVHVALVNNCYFNVYTDEQLPGLREKTVGSYEETLNCLSMGSQGRTTGATAMNTTSSRSHAIFTVHVEMKKKDDEYVCVILKLFLALPMKY